MDKIIPVILSGGAGERLWPLSRKHFPKQFIPLFDGKSLFARTFKRIESLSVESYVIVCNEVHQHLVLEEMQKMKINNFELILEPESRNTAPAIALATHLIKEKFPDSMMLALPSDHYVGDKDSFIWYITPTLLEFAQDNFIAFGVESDRPETAYGYVQINGEIRKACVHDVAQFIEKPNLETAKKYARSSLYFWNTGMFMFRPDIFLAALQQHSPKIADHCERAWAKRSIKSLASKQFIKPDAESFKGSPNKSIDYAIMEKVQNIKLCRLDVYWSDLGSWLAFANLKGKIKKNNILLGDKICTRASTNNIIYADSRLIATLGIRNHLIVEMKDAVLIVDQSHPRDFKKLIQKLKEAGYEESERHKKVYRPWGSYESVDEGENFQVKRIIVNPGQSLSLQSHRRRSEHWVVVRGTARVTLDDKVFTLEANQSTYIPIGSKHRLENTKAQPLHIIEVQCGDYLGEDDIERYEDNYGRTDE